VRMMILKQATRLIVLGVSAGVLIAAGLARTVRNLLFAPGNNDSAVFIGIPILLSVVALAACWIPATRATTIDPVRALREE
jgi:putative ABC transport system permease protein